MNFDHDRPTNLWDYEARFRFDGLSVYVSKVGGGTIGQSYEGHWHYSVFIGSTHVRSGSEFYTATSVTHQGAALQLRDVFKGDRS